MGIWNMNRKFNLFGSNCRGEAFVHRALRQDTGTLKIPHDKKLKKEWFKAK